MIHRLPTMPSILTPGQLGPGLGGGPSPVVAPNTSTLFPQYALVQNALLGGAAAANTGISDNPNQWLAVRSGLFRVIPLAGAACYPIRLETDTGAVLTVFDSSPVQISGTKVRVAPQTMAQAFGIGAVQTNGGLTDLNITHALYPAPAKGVFVAGSIANSAGYVGGLYGIVSVDDPRASGAALAPPFTYCTGYQQKLSTNAPSNSTPIPLPELINRGTGSGGIGALACAFLGAGQGVIRHTFERGSGWSAAHALYKWYLDPLTLGWLPGGSLNIGPGTAAGSVAVVEETVNLALPTWLYLQLDATDAGGDVLWTSVLSRGGR